MKMLQSPTCRDLVENLSESLRDTRGPWPIRTAQLMKAAVMSCDDTNWNFD